MNEILFSQAELKKLNINVIFLELNSQVHLNKKNMTKVSGSNPTLSKEYKLILTP